MARALPSQGGGGGFLGMRAEEEPGEGGEQAPDGGCEAVDGEEAPGPSPGPLTRGALGLDGPPPQGPLTQNHVAAAPPDLEDAPQQSPPESLDSYPSLPYPFSTSGASIHFFIC